MRLSGLTKEIIITRGCSKTSVFGTATLDLGEKPGYWPVFPRAWPKPTGFWNRLLGFSYSPEGVDLSGFV
jgi:hypothetical protein